MAIEYDWDIIQGWSANENADGTREYVRPVLVRGLTGMVTDNGAGLENPLVLIEAILAVRALGYVKGVAFSPEYPLAFLEDFRARTVDSEEAVMVELVYRQRVDDDSGHGSGSIWTLTDASQASHVITYATADGSKSLVLDYKSKEKSNGALGDPYVQKVNSANRVGGVHKVVVNRIITATAYLRNDDWIEWKKDVRAAAGRINSDQWGEDPRGMWLFLGPQTRFFERSRKVVHVTLTFVQDANLHYPIIAYIDERGIHPPDCTPEMLLRKGIFGGPDIPPAENDIKQANGITWCSVQKEVAFSPLFAFTPDQD